MKPEGVTTQMKVLSTGGVHVVAEQSSCFANFVLRALPRQGSSQ